MTFKMEQSIFSAWSFWKCDNESCLWLCDKPRSSFVSLPSDGLSVELLCYISHRCLVSPGILILHFPLWRSLINSFKAWKSILHPTWTLNVAGSVRNQTIANMMFSDGFYIEPRLSAVLHILIHLTLTSFLRTVNFASPLWGEGCRGKQPKPSRVQRQIFVCNNTLKAVMLSRRTFVF